MRAFRDLFADPTYPAILFQASAPPPNNRVTGEQMQQDGNGDNHQAPDSTETYSRGNVENADWKTDQRKDRQYSECRPSVHLICSRVDRLHIDLLMNQREYRRDNGSDGCDSAPRQFAQANAGRAPPALVFSRSGGFSRGTRRARHRK